MTETDNRPLDFYHCGFRRTNFYDLDNFQEFQCIKGGVYVGAALLIIGLLLAFILGVIKGITRLKRKDNILEAKGKSTSTHHIIEIDESKQRRSVEEEQVQDNQTDGEEKPYFKRVVYQSKYNPKRKKKSSRRKKKSLLRSLRRLSRLTDSSDEDYENATSYRNETIQEDEDDIDYENIGAKGNPRTLNLRMPVEHQKKSNSADEEELDYENIQDKY